MSSVISRLASMLVGAATLAVFVLCIAGGAAAQMCTMDAGCADGGTDAGPSDAGPSDAGPGDAGMSVDASVPDAGADAGVMDAGGTSNVAACSCETALDSDGRIHVCTGSFDRDTCKSFDCTEGSPRSARCPSEADTVRLCCTMEARKLYSQLYEDCTHANCESGFRAQCQEFGGVVSIGACDAPELPDDPETETGDSDGCSVAVARPHSAAWGVWLAFAAFVAWRRRARHLGGHSAPKA